MHFGREVLAVRDEVRAGTVHAKRFDRNAVIAAAAAEGEEDGEDADKENARAG